SSCPASCRRCSADLYMTASLYLGCLALLFTVAGGLLWDLGLNYDGVSGAAASKIHPATYLALLTFAIMLLARRYRGASIFRFLTVERGPLALMTTTMLVLLFSVVAERPGIAGLVDSFCMPA